MAKEAVRAGIVASRGFFLMEADYASLEVRGNAMVSLDPGLLGYLEDTTTDMHRDQAIELFCLHGMDIDWKHDKFYKSLRQFAKNQFVFAEFYGDFAGSTAKTLWKSIQKDSKLKVHMKAKGFIHYPRFEEHVYSCEKKLWQRFQVLKNWRIQANEFYKKNGYIQSFMGFRECGYLRKNQVCNMPVQGPCFHLLLWSASQINKWLKKRCGQE